MLPKELRPSWPVIKKKVTSNMPLWLTLLKGTSTRHRCDRSGGEAAHVKEEATRRHWWLGPPRRASSRSCFGGPAGAGREYLAAGQQALYRRAKSNGAASVGKYRDEMDLESAGADDPPHRRDRCDD
jgi:hypothetical protein